MQNEASSCGIAATDKVIKFLKLSDARAEEEKNELPLPALEDSSIMLDLSSSWSQLDKFTYEMNR